MIALDDISKRYGSVVALDSVSIRVERGEIVALTGCDGAGKSTLLRIITTLLLPDSGSGTVGGYDIRNQTAGIRRVCGYMPEKFSLYEDLTVEENLKFYATIYGTSIRDGYESIKSIYSQIERFKDRRAGALSGGMKQKLALSCALIHKPEVLFLDEPTTGVDPVSRKEFWTMLQRLKDQGLSILVSTPYMDEATLCDRIALIRKGVFLDTDTPSDIIAKFDLPLLAVSGPHMPSLLRDIRQIPQVFSCFAFGDTHHVVMRPSGDSIDAQINFLNTSLHAKGHNDLSIRPIRPNVEDCYMYLDSMEDRL